MMHDSTIDGVPVILLQRWQAAHAVPSLLRWRSLSQLAASIWVNLDVHGSRPDHAENLRLLADIARLHQIDMQPTREAT